MDVVPQRNPSAPYGNPHDGAPWLPILERYDLGFYSSTKTILDLLAPSLAIGTVIMFDEYFNYPGWEQHEFRPSRSSSLRAASNAIIWPSPASRSPSASPQSVMERDRGHDAVSH